MRMWTYYLFYREIDHFEKEVEVYPRAYCIMGLALKAIGISVHLISKERLFSRLKKIPFPCVVPVVVLHSQQTRRSALPVPHCAHLEKAGACRFAYSFEMVPNHK
jgi:hypothetical protein